jgi:hypothetical protein
MFAEQDAERGRHGDCPKGTACTVHVGKHWHDYGLAFAQTNGGRCTERTLDAGTSPR